jgi:hypothetical protein
MGYFLGIIPSCSIESPHLILISSSEPDSDTLDSTSVIWTCGSSQPASGKGTGSGSGPISLIVSNAA